MHEHALWPLTPQVEGDLKTMLGALAIVLVAGFFGAAAIAGGRQDTSCCFNAR
jgi:hypothetical protein